METIFSKSNTLRRNILLLGLGALFTFINAGLFLKLSGQKQIHQSIFLPNKPVEKKHASVVRTIDLTDYYNMSTVGAYIGSRRVRRIDNLANLPLGTNQFGGVAFWVEGAILLANVQTAANGMHPERVDSILVGGKCKRIHILHGLQANTDMNTPVAFFKAHYRNGKTMDIPIIYSKHVRCFNVLDRPAIYPPMDNSEVAWTEKASPVFKDPMIFRLYRTTFENPFPNEDLESLDYVSTLTRAASFLCGLSVE